MGRSRRVEEDPKELILQTPQHQQWLCVCVWGGGRQCQQKLKTSEILATDITMEVQFRVYKDTHKTEQGTTCTTNYWAHDTRFTTHLSSEMRIRLRHVKGPSTDEIKLYTSTASQLTEPCNENSWCIVAWDTLVQQGTYSKLIISALPTEHT